MQPELIAGAMTQQMREVARQAGKRGVVEPTLHVGEPGGELIAHRVQSWYDAGLRADLVARALDGLVAVPAMVWLTRAGELTAEDTDLAWLCAARFGFERHGLVLERFHVVTRHGWHEMISGQVMTWRRVRHQV